MREHPIIGEGSSIRRSGEPGFELESPNPAEFGDVRRNQDGAQRISVCCDQQIVRPDRLAGRFEFGADAAIFNAARGYSAAAGSERPGRWQG